MKLHYRQYSDSGMPLLILHGLFGSLSNWGWHSKQLAERFSVYGVDLRNHGASPHAAEHNYQVMAEDVSQLMQHLEIENCHMIGHSMGGKVAMQLALSYPKLLDRLIVVDIAPVAYDNATGGHIEVMQGMESLNFAEIASRAEAQKILSEYIEDEATRMFVLTNMLRNKDGKYSWRLNLSAIRNHYDKLRDKPVAENPFLNPVLFVKGALSNYIRAENKEDILGLFPAAVIKTIEQAGHWLHVEQPEDFQRLALEFLLEPRG